eukprot:gene34812-44632_t
MNVLIIDPDDARAAIVAEGIRADHGEQVPRPLVMLVDRSGDNATAKALEACTAPCMDGSVLIGVGTTFRFAHLETVATLAQTTLIEATLKRLQGQTSDICINAGLMGSDPAAALPRLDLPLFFDIP